VAPTCGNVVVHLILSGTVRELRYSTKGACDHVHMLIRVRDYDERYISNGWSFDPAGLDFISNESPGLALWAVF
jgi:hypothetical protein